MTMTGRRRPRSVGQRLAAAVLLAFLLSPLVAAPLAQAQELSDMERRQLRQDCWRKTECLGADNESLTGCSSEEGCCAKTGEGDERCYKTDADCDRLAGEFGKCYAKWPSAELTVHIGETETVVDLADYIAVVYNYAVGIAGIIAAVMMMIGGFQYLMAGGDAGRVAAGKQKIKNAIVGLFLALSAFLILQTINPNIVKLELPKVKLVKKQSFPQCDSTRYCAPCGVSYGLTKVPDPSYKCTPGKTDGTVVSVENPDVMFECIGRGCNLANDSCCDATTVCRLRLNENETNECTPTGTSDLGSYDERYICVKCKAEGQECSAPGRSAECCGGFCADMVKGDKCSAGLPGDTCDSNRECQSGLCQTNWGNSCSLGLIGSPCANDKECADGLVCSTNGSNTCSPGTEFSWCDDDNECRGGLVCNTTYRNTCQTRGYVKESCSASSGGIYGGCPSGTDYCQTMGTNFCTNGQPGSPCSVNKECAPPPGAPSDWLKSHNWVEGACARHTCMTGKIGGGCDEDVDCFNNKCYTEGDFGVCVSGGIGSRCDSQNDCDENIEDIKCTDGRCLIGCD